MRIRIVKCSNPHYWYINNVGEEFEVMSYSDLNYGVITSNRYMFSLVVKDDCELIEDDIKLDEYHRYKTVINSKDIELSNNGGYKSIQIGRESFSIEDMKELIKVLNKMLDLSKDM